MVKEEKIKVAVLIDSWFPLHGGGQVHVQRLSEELTKKGTHIDVFTRRLKDEKGHCLVKYEKGIPNIYRLGRCSGFYNIWGRISWLWQAYFAVKKAHKAGPYNLIHAHAFLAGLPGKFLQWKLKIPLVYTVHGTSLFYKPKGIVPVIERFLVCKIKYDQEISVAHNFLSLPNKNKNIAIIPNGVDLLPFEKIHPKKPQVFTILFVGRLDPIKGLNILIDAFWDWDFKAKPLEFRIVGEGPIGPELKKQAVSNPHIKFLGKKTGEEVIKEYKKAHLFVLPSFSEGQPITILEAFAAKCPVLATKVGDNERLITDGEDGFLVEPQNLESLKKALNKIYQIQKESPDLYQEIGQRGFNKIKKEYTWEKVGIDTFEIYKQLLS